MLALGETEVGPGFWPGAVPYQFTPGRGPGCPSSYKNILFASAKAFFGSLDLSIKVITPRLKLDNVKKFGVGNFVGAELSVCKGMVAYRPHCPGWDTPNSAPELSCNFHGLPQLPLLFSSCIVLKASSASVFAD